MLRWRTRGLSKQRQARSSEARASRARARGTPARHLVQPLWQRLAARGLEKRVPCRAELMVDGGQGPPRTAVPQQASQVPLDAEHNLAGGGVWGCPTSRLLSSPRVGLGASRLGVGRRWLARPPRCPGHSALAGVSGRGGGAAAAGDTTPTAGRGWGAAQRPVRPRGRPHGGGGVWVSGTRRAGGATGGRSRLEQVFFCFAVRLRMAHSICGSARGLGTGKRVVRDGVLVGRLR